MPLKNQIQLIAYPNRIGENLSDLADTLENDLAKAVGGVHILPMYPSNADAGFSPLTHKEVDPRFGTWEDIERISQHFDLCVDLTLNHISDESEQFKDFIAKGEESEWAEIFIDVAKLGPITKEDLAKIHIRKEKEPFREVTEPFREVTEPFRE
jgi:sucrose phosphorylase